MSELQVIESALARAAGRRRWARALRGLWHGLLVGAVLSLMLLGAYHLLPLPLYTLIIAALVPFPCLLAGLIVGGWRKPALAQVARWVDGRQHLQERLSTALEVAAAPDAGAWRDLVVTDAAAHARDLDPRRLLPLSLPKTTRWALVILALSVGLGFVPEYRSKVYLQKKAEQQNIKEVGRQLKELTRHNLEKRPPVLERTQKSMQAVTEVGDQLTKKALTRSEALKDLANVAEKLKDQLKELGKDPAFKKLEQAARASGGDETQTTEGLQKQIESAQKELGTAKGSPEALDKLKNDLAKLQQAAQNMADKNAADLQAERQKVSEALAALSKQLQAMGLQSPQLDDAINALAANQTDLFLKDLQASMNDLEKLRDMAKQLQQLQQQLEKIGKNLAEQLQNGQPGAAQMTLQKMVDQLRAANLSPEQLQKILQEVSQAVAPASNYGKVAEHLKDAAKQLQAASQSGDKGGSQSGDKEGAAQSLAAAADELAKLMQQMGDGQGLLAELDALNKASLCIGSGQGWRACNNPGFNPYGGRPGGGVGTWADANGTWDGQQTGGWDNSGVVRPDMAPRPLADRPTDLSDALKPTKVRGQFSPGGQMPSITLKGVSIKGQSTVSYEDAAAAAQSDAQSALSQEKVPRAYQGPVRDYFDDLKK